MVTLWVSKSRLRLAGLAVGYAVALAVVANLMFGASSLFTRGATTIPVRTGAYGGRLPAAAPVDGSKIALAINEANGGRPTIGMQLPADQPATILTATAPATVVTFRAKTTPSHTVLVKTTPTVTAAPPNWVLVLVSLYQAYQQAHPTTKLPTKHGG